ncbi:GNAT family N-acetyltransferase [Virgibacillus necropolis]|uniref:GNAT family N-acetyltransferase n=1 Tax=Virgibacillus necropolis TaxID=163877 RepID=UPI00384F56F2
MLREATVHDAKALLALIKQVEEESSYMLYEAGERNTTLESQRKMLEFFESKENSTIFVAEENVRLIGYLIVIGGDSNQQRHRAYLVIGILASHRGKGFGTALFKEVESWAKSKAIYRLDLTAVVDNEAGVNLYEKAGFEIEGVKRDSLKIDGEYVDEDYMGKLLD